MSITSEVFNIDCIEGMKKYPDKYFDLAIVDPPYGIDINKAGWIKQKKQANPHTDKNWDAEIPSKEYFEKGKKRVETFLSQGNLFMEKQQINFIDTCSNE